MDRYKETFDTWNNIASIYQDKFMTMDLYNDTYDFICNFIDKPKAKILEIGCGPGNITKYLLSKRPDFEILGIDFAPRMIELASLANPEAKFAVLDARNLQEIQDQFAGIVCGFCLPFLTHEELRKFIKDCSVLLIQNGLLYLSFVEGDPANSGFKSGNNGDRVYFNYHTLETVETLLAENQFAGLKLFHVNFKRSETEHEIHTILIARKS